MVSIKFYRKRVNTQFIT